MTPSTQLAEFKPRSDGESVAMGYTFLSTSANAPSRATLAEQQQTIEQFAAAQGFTLRGFIHETSETLSTQRQPRLERLIRGDLGLDWNVLLVARLDRLARQVNTLHEIITRIRDDAERDLISIEEGIDTRTVSGRFCAQLVGYFSAWDSNSIPDRTREWIALKRQKGEPIGHAPYGYTYQNKQLVVSEQEHDVMRMIRDLRGQQLSYEKIARYLNARNIPSKRGGGWYPETVKVVYGRAIATEA